ncbi:MAG: hypothetical protein H0T61_12085 [Actinobacteria bacterium]|nr:hypothetical protein [Actinomycetota bacterium]
MRTSGQGISPTADRGVIGRVRLSLALVVLALPALAPAATSTSVARHSKQQAEINLLHASKVLASWRAGLVDPRTKLLRGNTTAVCQGRGRPIQARFPRFACAIRNRTHIVSVRYLAQSKGGFEVRKLSVRRRAAP